MRAASRKTAQQRQRLEIDRYVREHYEEMVYDAVAGNAGYVARQAVAEFMLALKFHGYTAEQLREMYGWYLAVVNMPGKLLGRDVNADDAIRNLSESCGIDFGQMRLQYQSYEDFCKEREERAKNA